MKSIRLALLPILLFAALLGLLHSNVSAQWFIKTPQLLNTSSTYGGWDGGIFFEQGRLWAAGRKSASTPAEIFVSNDSGTSWSKVLELITVRSISFCDKNNGVISTSGLLRKDLHYYTSDGGNTWKNDRLKGYGPAKMISPLVICFAGSISYDGGYSTQDYRISPSPNEGIYNVGYDNAGGVFSSGINSFYISRDAGQTWKTHKPRVDNETWSSSGYVTGCGDSVIYLANEGAAEFGTGGGMCDIFVSRDGGKSFRSTYSNGEIHGDKTITGAIKAVRRGVAYCAAYRGLLRTTDYGETWHNIGGPDGILDCISFAVINDTTIAAIDRFGNVWMTTNSGGFPFPPPPPVVQPLAQGFALANVSSCDSGASVVKLTHQFCSPLIVTDVFPESSTSASFTLGAATLPDTLTDGKTLTIPVAFNPNKQVGSFSGGAQIKGYYVYDGDTMRIDTVIKFSATSKAIAPRLVSSPDYTNFDTVSTCNGFRDSVLTLTNRGCDALSITQGPGTLSPEFTLLTPLTLPYTLEKDSSVTLRFRFMPTVKGNFTTSPKFRAEQQGLTQDVGLILEGTGVEPPAYTLTASATELFRDDTVNICSGPITRTFRIASGGCVVPRVASQGVTGAAMNNYTLDAGVPDPLTGDDEVRITYTPRNAGVSPATYELTMSDGRKLVVPLLAQGIKIPYTVSITPNNLFATDSLYLCETTDRSATITLSGCPLPHVVSEGIIGASAGEYILKTKSPDSIVNQYTFDITFTPTGTGLRDAKYKLTFDDGTSVEASLLGYGLKSVPLTLVATTPTLSTDTIGGTVSVPIRVEGLTEPHAVELSLGFDPRLDYLGTTSLSGTTLDVNGTVTKQSSLIRIPSAEVKLTGPSAYASFNVFADTLGPAQVTVSDLKVVDANVFCQFSTTGTATTIITGPEGCGFVTISDFLRYGKTPRFSIRPNPTTGSVVVRVSNPNNSSPAERVTNPFYSISVFDAMGIRRGTPVACPRGEMTLDLSSLPSGIYFIRIHGEGFTTALPVVVER